METYAPYVFNREAYERRMKWFTEARFGMFLHWGLYAIPARGEWVRSQERISLADYQPYFEEFNPADYDPVRWAKTAKAAGMKYMVLTAKHHDGFCLFDSQLTDYTALHTPCKRDLVREFLEAGRAEGLKVGLYYSLLDWHHPDYPHFSDPNHPMRGNPDYLDEGRDFNRYLNYMHGQVRELCTNYGKLDILWFDFSYDNLRVRKLSASLDKIKLRREEGSATAKQVETMVKEERIRDAVSFKDVENGDSKVSADHVLHPCHRVGGASYGCRTGG